MTDKFILKNHVHYQKYSQILPCILYCEASFSMYRVSQKKIHHFDRNNSSDFKIQTFTSSYLKKEVIIFSFDLLFGLLRETHRAKGCDKNVINQKPIKSL